MLYIVDRLPSVSVTQPATSVAFCRPAPFQSRAYFSIAAPRRCQALPTYHSIMEPVPLFFPRRYYVRSHSCVVRDHRRHNDSVRIVFFFVLYPVARITPGAYCLPTYTRYLVLVLVCINTYLVPGTSNDFFNDNINCLLYTSDAADE